MKVKSSQPSVAIRDVQSQIRAKELELRIKFVSMTKREKDVLMKTVKLQEEVGELANDILATLSLQRKSKLDAFDKHNLYEEFGDVILQTLSLANTLRVDADRAVREKLEKVLKVYIKDR